MDTTKHGMDLMLAELAPIGFCVIENGIITELNKFARDEFSAEVGEPFSARFLNQSETENILQEVIEEGKVCGRLVHFTVKNGEYHRFLLDVHFFPDKGKFIAWATPLEAIEREKERSNQSVKDLERLVFLLPIPVLMIDQQTRKAVYANDSFCKMVKAEAAEMIIDRNFSDFFPDMLSGGWLMELLRSKLNIRKRGTIKTLGDRVLNVEAFGVAIRYHGKNVCVLLIRDITIELESRKLLESIAHKEKESNQLKSRFLVNMSHEIRTPMNAIIGLSEIALRKPELTHNFASETFKKISSSSRVLLGIINDILDFSKIEAEKLDIASEEFQLEDTLGNVMIVVSQRVTDKPVDLYLDAEMDVPIRLVGDSVRLWQVLKNFLDNSAKFTNKGSILLHVKLLDRRKENCKIRFTVTDTGVGISAAGMEKLFTPFEQFGQKAAQNMGGTGLGMSIAKQLIEMMGGTINVVSELNRGTEITIDIPFALPPQTTTFADYYGQYDLTGARMMCVDYSPIAQQVINRIFSGVGVPIEVFADGESAYERIVSAYAEGIVYDSVMINFDLAGKMQGVELFDRLKAEGIPGRRAVAVSEYHRKFIKDRDDIPIVTKAVSPGEFCNDVLRPFAKSISGDLKVSVELPRFPGARVLVAEDNEINQEVALGMLEEFGIKADIAENGLVAIEKLEQSEYDLVFMDIQMPVMDGHTAIKAIRASRGKPYQEVPVVAMTANVMSEEISVCAAEGMSDQLPKPIEFDKLQAVLVKYLGELWKSNT